MNVLSPLEASIINQAMRMSQTAKAYFVGTKIRVFASVDSPNPLLSRMCKSKMSRAEVTEASEVKPIEVSDEEKYESSNLQSVNSFESSTKRSAELLARKNIQAKETRQKVNARRKSTSGFESFLILRAESICSRGFFVSSPII